MFKSKWLVVGLMGLSNVASAAENPADVDTVINAMKRGYPNLSMMCSIGLKGIRNQVNESLYSPGVKLKGNPSDVGDAVAAKIWSTCPR